MFLFNLFISKRFRNFGLKSKQHKLKHKMTDFDMTGMLQELGLKAINNGTSTGKNSFSSNETIESY